MDARSEGNLAHVHADLARVVRRASQLTVQPFIVIHGIRTMAEEASIVSRGASETMHSRHLPNRQGVACAVDVMATITDKAGLHADWNPAHYQPIAAAILSAAHENNVLVEWGGNWKSLKDWGHFQLPWAVYP